MALEKSPAFQFYPKDFLTDSHVVAMTLPERGAYITLLCLCWMERSLPSDQGALARLCRVSSAAFTRLWPALEPCFTVVDGRLVQPRIERERQKQETYRALKIDAGHKGGLAKASSARKSVKHTASRRLAKPSPPSSSSISDLRSAEKEEREKRPLSPAAPSDAFTNDGITQRAGAFIRRYQVLYPEHRSGARYLGHEHRDYIAAVSLCEVWSDARLEKLAVCFLTTNHKFAEEGSRTIPQLRALASWLDGELAKWERDQATGS